MTTMKSLIRKLALALGAALALSLSTLLSPALAAAGGMGRRQQAGQGQGQAGTERHGQFAKEGRHVVHSWGRPFQCGSKVTRSGTALNSPMRLHQGISRKKPK